MAGLLGCGSRAPVTGAGGGSVSCPSVAIDVSAFDAELGTSIDVSAGPMDTTTAGAVGYSWSADSGDFGDPGARATTYRCSRAAGAGPQGLRVAATRGLCTVTQQIVIVCSDPPIDAGAQDAPGGGDAAGDASGPVGGETDAGVDGIGGGCGLDPTIDEGASCNDCTLANCTTLESAQMDVPPTAGCHHLASDADRRKCEALYCCIREHQCTVDGDPTACWCGSVDPVKCTSGQVPANGPCVKEIEAAAGVTEPSTIALRLVDPTFAIGGAVNLAICRASYCASPPSPECGGY